MSELLRQANRKKANRIKELMLDPEWYAVWREKLLAGQAKAGPHGRYPRPLARLKSGR